jgi:hypothetical protein
MNARRRMVTGKHPAIRLGLSIAGILICAARVHAQAPSDATFHILENGTAIGSATISIARDEDGWRVQSTSRAAGTIGLDVLRLEVTYDRSWRMCFLSMELARGRETRVIHVAIQGLRARTDVVLPDREAGFGAHRVSPGTIAVPDYVFGAYQALAARVETLAPGTDIPILLTPRSEFHATVDAVRDEDVQTTSGAVAARRVSVLVIRDVPTPIEIWVAEGSLLTVEWPLDPLSLIRSDIH